MKALKIIGYVMSVVQLIVSGVLIYLAMSTKAVPVTFGIIGAVILVAIPVGLFFMTRKESRKLRITAIIISVVLTVLLGFLCYFVSIANKALEDVTGNTVETDEIKIYISKDDEAASVNEAVTGGYLFGTVNTVDESSINKIVDEINNDCPEQIKTEGYDSIYAAIGAFESGRIQGIIVNEGTIVTLDASEEYKDYSKNNLKVIMVKEVENQISEPEAEVDMDRFCLYISGIDTFGSVTAKSRSDVNIIAVINNKTKTVLLVSTPRDYYVKLADVNKDDKLTHAGLYGIENSMGTLKGIYDVDLDYYVRINFSGFQKIIDKLGGVDVYSQYSFSSVTEEGTYSFNAGTNHLNGEEALGFARSRNFTDGDRQRGRNQMQVIKAVIEKLESSSMLKNYGSLMDEMGSMFQTNMQKEDIGYLVQSTLEDGKWKILTYSVGGNDSERICYSLGTTAYVMIPNKGDIEYGNKLISRVLGDEEVKQDEIDVYIVNKDNEDIITEEKPTEGKSTKESTTER
ncbi:transcriptional attenuator, LytR family [Lachnospiraceae bacterium]|nr:transcriptional attenuator, LytR family [Lachnospiraceae bacterium]